MLLGLLTLVEIGVLVLHAHVFVTVLCDTLEDRFIQEKTWRKGHQAQRIRRRVK